MIGKEEKFRAPELLDGIEAVIFDMDGTMVNNMPFHNLAWKEFCKRKGLELTDEQFKQKISGKKNKEIFQIILSHAISKEELKKLSEEKEEIYREIYKRAGVEEIAGLSQLLNLLKSKKLPIAIATTSPKKNREFVLEMIGISKSDFSVIVGDVEVEKGKPDPEIYLKTAEKMAVEPSRCLVFEDTKFGVESAKKAGMRVVALTTSHNKNELSGADFIMEDFTQVVNKLN